MIVHGIKPNPKNIRKHRHNEHLPCQQPLQLRRYQQLYHQPSRSTDNCRRRSSQSTINRISNLLRDRAISKDLLMENHSLHFSADLIIQSHFRMHQRDVDFYSYSLDIVTVFIIHSVQPPTSHHKIHQDADLNLLRIPFIFIY